MSYTREVAKGMTIVFICVFLANVFAYLLRLFLARSLSVTEYGLIYSIFALFGFISSMQTLGLNDALVQYLPGVKSTTKMKNAFITVIYSQLAITAIISTLAIIFAGIISKSYLHDISATPLIILFAIAFFVSPIEMSLISFFQGIGKTAWYGYMVLLRAVILFALICLLVLSGWGVQGVFVAYVIVYLIIPVIYLPILLRTIPDFSKTRGKFDVTLFKKLFSVGFPVMLSNTIGIFLSYIDIFFLTIYTSLSDVALYNVALPTASILWFLSSVIYAVMLPIVSSMRVNKRFNELGEGIGRMYVYLLILILPASAILIMFPDIIINALFGANYIGAAPAMQLLVIGGVFYAFSSLNVSVITALGKPKLSFISLCAAAFVNVVLDILLIPKYAIMGSAIATMSAFIILFLLNFVFLQRVVKVRIHIMKVIGVFVATAIFCGVVVYLRYAIMLPLWWKVAVSIVLGAIAYVALIFLLRIVTVDELTNMKKIIFKK